MLSAATYRLSVHADPLADALLRILNLVAAQPIVLASVRHRQGEGAATTVLEIVEGACGRADLLALRLRQAPWIRDVQLLETAGGSNDRSRSPKGSPPPRQVISSRSARTNCRTSPCRTGKQEINLNPINSSI